MGYTKYNEDDKHIIMDRIYMHQPKIFEKVKPKVIFFDCPYCNSVFKDKEKMYSHIKEKHNILYPVFTINEKVPRWETTCYENGVQNATIHLFDFAMKISLNGECLTSSEDLDLTDRINEILNRGEVCKLQVGEHNVIIRGYSVDYVRKDRILPVINEWNRQVEEQKAIERCDSQGLTSVEKEYLDGFYNYFIACDATCKNKSERYDDAWRILSNFSKIDALSSCALKAIAFRRNWVEQLFALCQVEDDFMIVKLLYQCNGSEQLKGFKEGNQKLFIEDTLQQDLNLAKALFTKDWEFVEKHFKQIHSVDDFDDVLDVNHKNRQLLYYALYQIHNKQNRIVNECVDIMIVPAFQNIILKEQGKMI